MTEPSIDELVAKHKPGHALEREFYVSQAVFERDVARIIMKSWILVGHASQLREEGAYFVCNIANESIIVVRSSADSVYALLNVCRHRGSRVCLESSGRTSRFVCPYHAWTYDLEGNLLAVPQAAASVDRSDYPLKRVPVEIFHGMVFVNFDPDADFSALRANLDDALAPYDLANTKIAHRQNYGIDANWKLAVENFNECYHCLPAHREYSVGHSLARPEKVDAEQRQLLPDRAESCGLWPATFDASYKNASAVGTDCYFDRYPLLKGHVTGSRDGQPVAPLLGSVQGYDGAAADFQVGVLSFGLAYCDHVVLYRFIPVHKDRTECEVIWLVRADAEEGRDYELDELIWLWDVTTVADKRIIQDNSRGMESRFYEPGPFTPMETYTQKFIEWYLDVLKN